MDDKFEVVVAIIGDPSHPIPGDVLWDRFRDLPYEERPKVELEVSPDETLGNVLQRAATEAGTEVGGFTGFYRAGSQERPTWSPVVSLVDDQGRVTWGHYFGDVSYSELLKAGDAGALPGDPRRPYLVLQHGIGNGVLPDWHTLQTLWEIVFYTFNAIAAAGGTAATFSAAKRKVLDRLRSRAQAAATVIEERGQDWASRDGQPYDLEEWLDDRPWLPADLAPLLGCSEAEAEALLWAFGFVQAPSGVWRRSADQEGALFSEAARLGVRGYTHAASQEQLRAVIREEVEHFLAEGEARQLELVRTPWLDEPEDSDSATAEKFKRTLSPLYHARAWIKKKLDG